MRTVELVRASPPLRQRALLAALAMASGAALVASVFTRVSLGVTLLCGALCVALLARLTWLRLPAPARPLVLERVAVGVVGGLLATGAYDLARLALVEGAGLRIWPFDTFPLFGEAILGPGAPHGLALAVGVAYHYLNGMSFGAGYALLFRRRPFLFGIPWGLGLECAMLLVYPHWLPGLSAVLGEFTAVSLTGHLAYGIVLGLLVQLAPLRGRVR